jgi:hypothetical protein
MTAVSFHALRRSATPQVRVYANEGHSFTKGFAADAGDRALEFLRENLVSRKGPKE